MTEALFTEHGSCAQHAGTSGPLLGDVGVLKVLTVRWGVRRNDGEHLQGTLVSAFVDGPYEKYEVALAVGSVKMLCFHLVLVSSTYLYSSH